MKFEPVKYRKIEIEPLGCFEVRLTDSGWAESRFDHDIQLHLLSDEVGEFVRLVDQFFHECSNWDKLQKYVRKYGKKVLNDDGMQITAINFDEAKMTYTFTLDGNLLRVYPYRKFMH